MDTWDYLAFKLIQRRLEMEKKDAGIRKTKTRKEELKVLAGRYVVVKDKQIIDRNFNTFFEAYHFGLSHFKPDAFQVEKAPERTWNFKYNIPINSKKSSCPNKNMNGPLWSIIFIPGILYRISL